ncbi:hypothetical protein VTK73DRAFT_2590 [Phialemonium thermophilum]|uniref:DUF7924 domain-containing protein n=1 Tax=Phialemonium thermophilum TaxID=223376 RepID=A0ABR3VRX7_9PEZI
MRGRVSKPRSPRSRPRPSQASRTKRLDAFASSAFGLPPQHRDRPLADGRPAQDTTSSQSGRQPLDPASANDPAPPKTVRFTPTDKPPTRRSARLEARRRCREDPSRLVPSVPPREPQAAAGVAGGDSSLSKAGAQTNARRLRKRQVGSDDDDNEQVRRPKRLRLTRENLAKLNRNMPKKATGRASASAARSDVTAASTSTKTTSKTTSTTTSGFADQAYRNGILDPVSSKPPRNLDDIRSRFAQPRRTASPTESAYEDYVYNVASAVNESTMVVEVSGQLLKKYDGRGYPRAFNQAFTAFPRDVGFNDGLSTPQPDFVEGVEKQGFRPFPVNDHVEGAVLYRDNPHSVVLPHVAGEWKGPGKDMTEARLQSAYDGAALVYARNQALAYLGQSDPPGYAEVTTFTTDGTNLNLYAHYAALSEDGTLEYHQYPVKSVHLTDSHQGFRDGRRALRNGQDYAREQSYAMRDRLKERWRQQSRAVEALPVAEDHPTETNADGTGYVVDEQPCQPTPTASSPVQPPEVAPNADDHDSGSSGRKRKASSSQRRSRGPGRPKDKARAASTGQATRRSERS